ncbi:MAG: hypothetical protein ACW99G_09830 [Candidatus Thorarchaeota archaeon]|jgi:hypothetical protein
MEKSDTNTVPLLIIGIILIVLAGFNTSPTGVTTWLNYLSIGFFAGGVTALILAACENPRQKKSDRK